MTHVGPRIGSEDEFEGLYSEKFRTLVRPEGEFVQYERDRASLDIGLHLTTPSRGGRHVSHTRIWFQLKGIHERTVPLKAFTRSGEVAVSVRLDQLKFWFASPEPIYVVVYVEAADTFLIDDVRDIVDRQWGERFFAPGTFRARQKQATLKIPSDARLTRDRLVQMRKHQSMRIDGPFFRGRPLGHHLDPLRSSLNPLDPCLYVSLTERLLAVHDYRISNTLEPSLLFSGNNLKPEYLVLTEGRLYNTFEWMPQPFTEFGVDSDDDFRIEATPEYAHGPVAVCIHGNPQSHPDQERLQAFTGALLSKGIPRLLVCSNREDIGYFGAFFDGCRRCSVRCMPQLLGDVAYSLLTATVVYLEFRESVSWKYANYLWEVPNKGFPADAKERRG